MPQVLQRRARLRAAPAILALGLPLLAQTAPPVLEPAEASRFARLALDCVHKEYPNHLSHALNSDADAKPPRELTPAFYGCYDWHSSVHGHWLLARLARLFPAEPFAAEARRALNRSLSEANLRGEARYLSGEGRNTFERPYGLAWLLQLAAELREWDDPDARRWSANLRPLEDAAVVRISAWLPKLQHPIRNGEHTNTAFGLGLMLDYARVAGKADFGRLLESRSRDYFLRDRGCPISWEPSGEDFLSPCLAEADVMRRILPEGEFARWFDAFLPDVTLEPTRVSDVTDGRLYHLAGLNLSRAWMLEGIARQLPQSKPRRGDLSALAVKLRSVGMESVLDTVKGAHYEGGHWLASFAVYLATGRGLR